MKLAEEVTNRLEAIDWANEDPDNYKGVSNKAVAEGIYAYITNEDNYNLIANVVGTLTTPAGVITPYSGGVKCSLTFPNSALLSSVMNTTIEGDSNGSALISSVYDWLDKTPILVTGWTLESESLGATSPPSSVMFTTLPIQATLFDADIRQGDISNELNLPEMWELVENYIIDGLLGTFALSSVTGTLTTGLFTAGTGSGSIEYK